jgi:hypothetical protein
MKKLFMTALASVLFLTGMGAVRAGDHHGSPMSIGPPCPETRVRKFYEIKFVPIEVTTLVEKAIPRELVTREKCVEQVPVWTEQKKCVTTYKKVARVIEKEQVCCKLVPECVTDPCTGCTKTCYKPCTYVKKVSCTVYDCVPEQKEITEKVCKVECREKIVEHRCQVTELVKVPVKEKVTLVTLVPFTSLEEVKACACPPKCCGGCK